jgi:NADH-quinone oxidoreductase subunit G
VWFVNKSPAICTGCANGCNVYVESRGDRAYRVLPRRNEEVNQVWMCDEGRLTYHATNENRVEFARQGKGEAQESVGARLAVERAVELLKPIAGQGGIAMYLSAQCTNEELAAALLLGRELGVERYVGGGKPAGDSDDFLIRADKNPNTNGVLLAAEAFGVKLDDDFGTAKALVAFRTDDLAVPAGVELFVAVAQNEDAASSEAHVILPCKSAYEQDGSLINWYGRLQRTWESVPAQRADAAAGWAWAERILRGLGGSGPKGVAHAFSALAQKSPHLTGLSFDQIPDDGIILEGLLPSEWPARAPRPLPGGHSMRGPQTTPPGMKVGDEASGGSR